MNAFSFFSVRRALPALALIGLLAGCPQVPNPDPLPAAPSIGEFKASATQVSAGATVTLSWKVENATEVRIDELSLGRVSGVDGNEGSVDVAVGADVTYVLTARNDRGAADSAIVSVRVSGTAREALLVAVPDAISAGESVALAWTAPGAASVTLSASPGGAIDIGGQSVAGTVTVTPSVTTVYSLVANGRTRSTTVTVTPGIGNLTATAVAADGGTHVRVEWTTTGATSVTLSGAGRGQLVEVTDAAQVASGSFEEALPADIDPSAFLTYELTASAGGASSTRTVNFGIPGNPAIISFTGPEAIRQTGGTLTLAWTTLEAAAVSVSAGTVEIYRAPADKLAAGSLSLPIPADDTEYTLTARGARGGQATKSLLVDVVSTPTVTLTATPDTVNAGDTVTLSWSGTHIRNVSVREVGFGNIFTATGIQDTGSTTASTPAGNVTYVIDVDNGLGDFATATTQVTVNGGITLTLAETGALRQGQNVTVSWTAPTGAGDIIGLPHTTVDVRAGSAGFDDIATTGTAVTFTSAATPGTIVTPFRMPFFGQVVGSTINVSRHGYIGFSDVNGDNSWIETLPSPYLEDLVVAPNWREMPTAAVRWQVKTEPSGDVLIVQWNSATEIFQTKLHSTGQIDFEYSLLPSTGTASVGITGRYAGQTIIAPAAAAVGQGFTFFGPRPSPVTLPAWEEGAIIGYVPLASGNALRTSVALEQVVLPGELVVNEVLPNSLAGVNGQWAELRNARTTPLTIDGWSFGLPDGGEIPLSGTVPARGVLVVGATTDDTLNGDAGVQVAVPGFDLSNLTSLVLQRGGIASTLPLSPVDAGVALQNSSGPFLHSSTAIPAGDQRCAATTTFGSLAQYGTPGVDTHCGFPYDLTRIKPGFFDISTIGNALTLSSFDSATATLDFSSAPVNFFGAPRTSAVVSTNGILSFATLGTTDYLASTPSTSAPNLLVAAFAGDLSSTAALGGQLSYFRAGAGVDPAAAAPHWIVQWTHYYYYYCNTADLNFQIKLFDDGIVEVHYGRMQSSDDLQCAVDSLAAVSSWLENAAGTQALNINARSVSSAIRPYSAFRYTPR